ncbi:MAG TPA: efflux RND transporter periplasmic adaptor subunit [Bryobacteraceae bacterium]|nr:efflux RND transporter periplasmic adaptor subunit [Bryobacteraceae bacterium]
MRRTSTSKPLRLTCAVLVAVAAAGLQACGDNKGASEKSDKGGGRGRGEGGPAPVVVAKVAQKDVPVNIDVIGNVEAYTTISVRAEVGGQLTKVFFSEGDYVKKNAPLFEIDPRPFRAQLSQAQAQLSQAQANSARDAAAESQAEANLARDIANQKYAAAESARYARLFSQGIVSREQNDQLSASAEALSQTIAADKAAIQSAQAQIAADKAAAATAEAMVENAQVQLSYTSIVSPIEGRTGNLSVKQGNLVAPNSSELTTIAQVQPIYVTFAVPESQLTAIRQHLAEGKLQVQAQPQDDATRVQSGVVTFIDNTVDPSTGTIKVKGTFQNEGNVLWPGQFVRVTLRLAMLKDAIVVPNEAVQTGQDGTFVYVVKDDRTVAMRPVVTGPRVDQDLVIERGLEPGDTVVTEGQLRLAPNSRVTFGEGRGRGRGRGDGKGAGRADAAPKE